MTRNKIHYKTIVISDTHLGIKNSRALELVKFIKNYSCDNLILNGDIIDGWRLQKNGKWEVKHTRFFRKIIKMSEKINTKIVYIRGNHDDFLDSILPFEIGNFKILKEYYYISNDKKYYVIHGDVFDRITSNFRWIAKLGDIGYTLLLWVNKIYNNYRTKRGLPYYSLSQTIKNKVKSAVSYISDFEKELVVLAKSKGCDGIICGHIHRPEISTINGIEYLNSGDWVESLSALAEDYDGNWNLLLFNDLIDLKD